MIPKNRVLVNTTGSHFVLCAQGWAGQAQPPFSQWRFSLSEKRNSAAEKSESESGQKFLFPDPFPFCPPERKTFLKIHFGVFVKKYSNFAQKTPPIFTFCEIVRNSLGAKRLGVIFFRNFPSVFKIARQRAVGNAEVRRAKHGQNEILQTNLFSFAFGERLSVFFFDCPKTNFKTI